MKGNYMANTKVVPMKRCVGVYSPALSCSGDKKVIDFYDSQSQWDDGKVCLCKSCVDKVYQQYLSETRSEKLALYYTLAKIDISFIKDVFNATYDDCISKGKQFSVGAYMTRLNKLSDKVHINFSRSDSLEQATTNTIEQVEEQKEELEKLKKIWGEQQSMQDYEFLTETYDRYMDNFDDALSAQQEDLLRDVCRDRLLLRKLNDNTYSGEETIDKVQKRLASLLSTLQLDNFSGNQKKTLSELSFVEKIMMIETTKPADLYKEQNKYKDHNHRAKYYRDLVLRPLLNSLCGSKEFALDHDDFEKYNEYCDSLDRELNVEEAIKDK